MIEFLKNLKLKNFKELSYASSMCGLNFRQILFDQITNPTHLDPFIRLHESCCDLIFQNFCWFDLQKLSKVSTLWFHAIECASNLITLHVGDLSDSVLQYCDEHMKILKKLIFINTEIGSAKLEASDVHRGMYKLQQNQVSNCF